MNGSETSDKTHRPWDRRAKPRKKNARFSSLVIGKNGKQYWVSINGNGMVGVQEVTNGQVKTHERERLRYADEIHQWMTESAKAADNAPPTIGQG